MGPAQVLDTKSDLGYDGYSAPIVLDENGDGDMDLAIQWLHYYSETLPDTVNAIWMELFVLHQDNAGQLVDPTTYQSVVPVEGAIAACDLNSDGFEDVVMAPGLKRFAWMMRI